MGKHRVLKPVTTERRMDYLVSIKLLYQNVFHRKLISHKNEQNRDKCE